MSYGVNLCDTPVPTKHCDVCHIHLCEECEGRHFADESKEHVIVSFEMRWSTPKCSKHSTRTCARYCKKCKTPFCASCGSFGNHRGHKTKHLSKISQEPWNTDLQTGTKFTPLEMEFKIIVCSICSIFIYYVVVFLFLSRSGSADPNVAYCYCSILSSCLEDFLFFCMKSFCGLDFMEFGHLFEYLKWLMTKSKEPRKFHSQTAIMFTYLKQVLKIIIYYICISIIESYVSSLFYFLVDPGRKIHLQLIVIVLNVILSFCFMDFLSFCLKSVCGLELIEFGYLFEYLKWLMTRTKELRKNDLQTTTNVSPSELTGRYMS